MAVPRDAPPSAPLSPKADSAPGPSVQGMSGDADRARVGIGTDKVTSVAGTEAEDGAGSELRAATRGGASSRGASTRCPESCALSAGGCTDSHTQTHANSNSKTCIVHTSHERNSKKNKRKEIEKSKQLILGTSLNNTNHAGLAVLTCPKHPLMSKQI